MLMHVLFKLLNMLTNIEVQLLTRMTWRALWAIATMKRLLSAIVNFSHLEPTWPVWANLAGMVFGRSPFRIVSHNLTHHWKWLPCLKIEDFGKYSIKNLLLGPYYGVIVLRWSPSRTVSNDPTCPQWSYLPTKMAPSRIILTWDPMWTSILRVLLKQYMSPTGSKNQWFML